MPKLAKPMSPSSAMAMAWAYFPSFLEGRDAAEELDRWHRGEQDVAESLYMPPNTSTEYDDLADVSRNAWAGLVVKSLVQNAELTGMRMSGSEGNVRGWATWQRNQMNRKQSALYTASCAHGAAFVWASKSSDRMTGLPMSKLNISSAMEMATFYDPDDDEWPVAAILARPKYGSLGQADGFTVRLWEDGWVHYLSCKGTGLSENEWTYISHEPSGADVVPVVRYAPNVDIDGRANSDLQGFLPLLRRIDQDTFDRLIVQRFGAWKVRYIAGLVRPTNKDEALAQKIKLSIDQLLIAEDADTKFGTLDATDLAGFIAARDSDLRDLSALSQTPPHHMLGLASNLQAESLAAAESGLQRNSRGHRISWGESNEQTFRLDAHMRGDTAEAAAHDMTAIWRDTESRSLEQAAQALSTIAQGLNVPVEMLWERIPGWTKDDSERARQLVLSGDSIDTLIAEVQRLTAPEQGQPADEPAV